MPKSPVPREGPGFGLEAAPGATDRALGCPVTDRAASSSTSSTSPAAAPGVCRGVGSSSVDTSDFERSGVLGLHDLGLSLVRAAIQEPAPGPRIVTSYHGAIRGAIRGAACRSRVLASPPVDLEQLERVLRERLDALGPAPRAELLHVPTLLDFDRADRIGEFYGNPKTRTFAELLIDAEEDPYVRAVLVGMLRDAGLRFFSATGRTGNQRCTGACNLGVALRGISSRAYSSCIAQRLSWRGER